jgi:hypothetical protein
MASEASSQLRARFQQGNLVSGFSSIPGGGDAGDASADDDDVQRGVRLEELPEVNITVLNRLSKGKFFLSF